MKTQQPVWKFLANLGDVNPIEYGGKFVYFDETGVYAPEVEVVVPPPDDVDLESPDARWTTSRFIVEPCTFQNGILSNNPYHPEIPAWWAKDLQSVADCVGMGSFDLLRLFLSPDPIQRAQAYLCLVDYFGAFEFDQYPNEYTHAEITARYSIELQRH